MPVGIARSCVGRGCADREVRCPADIDSIVWKRPKGSTSRANKLCQYNIDYLVGVPWGVTNRAYSSHNFSIISSSPPLFFVIGESRRYFEVPTWYVIEQG